MSLEDKVKTQMLLNGKTRTDISVGTVSNIYSKKYYEMAVNVFSLFR
jgi:hypothetical protein